MENTKEKLLIHSGIFTLVGTAVLACGGILCSYNNLLSGIFMMLLAVALYFYIALSVAQKNWLDLRAVFSGIWLGTIGLAALRLTAYQEEWQTQTWILLGVTFFIFHMASLIADLTNNKILDKLTKVFSKIKIKTISFKSRENRLFTICLITTLIGMICFVINIAIKGFIPCFSSDPFAYINFYTKLHPFSVGSSAVCGLCYYCIKTQKISIFKKIILYFCILYSLILFPVMIVSRGVFICLALYFTTVVFYLNKRRFTALVLCLVTILTIYLGVSKLRNFTDAQLSILFEPVEVELTKPDKSDTEDTDTKTDTDTDNDTNTDTPVPSFSLSPQAAFLYGYLTVGHDNFNEAVQNLDEYTWGCRTARPFNVLLKIPQIDKIDNSVQDHFVRPHLNTYNFLGEYYYDFHSVGVIIFVFILAFISMIVQKATLKYNNMILPLVLGLVFQEIFLVFFSNMAARFELWMHLGVILIFGIAASINFLPHKTDSK